MAWGQRVDRTGVFERSVNADGEPVVLPNEIVVAYVGDEAVASMPEPAFDRLVSRSESAPDYERRLREAGFHDLAPARTAEEQPPAA